MHRIAMISAHTCPLARLGTRDAGGMNVYVGELSKSLSSRGFEIDVFTRCQDPSLPVMTYENGVRIVYLKAGPQSPYPKEFLPRYFGEFLDEIVSFAEVERYGLIHSHHWLSGWIASELKDRWGVPMIHTFHTLGRLKPSTQYRLKMEMHTIREAESIIATSGAERVQLIQYYNAEPTKVDVIPCGVNLRLFRRLDPDLCKEYLGLDDKDYLLFVGRMDPVKSIETLLESMRLLHSRAHLLVIGGEEGNSQLQKMKRIASNLGIADSVTFLGAKPQTILPYYYSVAEVCVLPSRYESFGLVVLEAMACGTPVIASGVGGIPEVVENNETGFLVTPGDEKEIADKIDWVMRDKNLRDHMSLQAQKRARQFGWQRVAGRVASVYHAYTN